MAKLIDFPLDLRAADDEIVPLSPDDPLLGEPIPLVEQAALLQPWLRAGANRLGQLIYHPTDEVPTQDEIVSWWRGWCARLRFADALIGHLVRENEELRQQVQHLTRSHQPIREDSQSAVACSDYGETTPGVPCDGSGTAARHRPQGGRGGAPEGCGARVDES